MIAFSEALLTFFSDNPFLERLFFVSLEVALLVALIEFFIRTGLVKSARLQSLLWLVVMVKASLGLAVGPAFKYAVVDDPKTIVTIAEPKVGPARARPAMRVTGTAASSSLEPTKPTSIVPQMPPAVPAKPARPFAFRGSDVPHYILPLWIVGAVFACLRVLLDHMKLRRVIRTSEPAPTEVGEIFFCEARALNLYITPRLLVTERLESPAVAGIFHPVVFLPKWMLAEQQAALAWALRHELTHCKMGDPMVQGIRLLAQALLFFHPLVRWAGKRWEEAAELACDRALLRTESDVTHYAEQLLAVLARTGPSRRAALMSGLCATRSSLGNRIAALFSNPLRWPPHLDLKKRVAMGVFIFLVLCIGFRLVDREAHAQNAVPTSTGTLPARTLYFPEDHSMGTVRIGGNTIDARGLVHVPEGFDARLSVSDTALADLPYLSAMKPNDLQHISLSSTAVQDSDLVYLSHLTGLRDVELFNTSIGNEGVSYLQNLTNLERINLNATQITDQGLSYLQNMTQMEELVLNRTNVSDAGMQYLANMSNLRYIDLWQANITDEGLAQLSNLTNLTELGLENTLITDAGMAYLARLTKLSDLNLESNDITDAGLQYLRGLTQLQALDINNTDITDQGLAALSGLQLLSRLDLPFQISPAAVRILEKLPAFANLRQRLAFVQKTIQVREQGSGRGIPNAQFSLRGYDDESDAVSFYRTGADGLATMYLPPPRQELRLRGYAEGYVTDEVAFAAPVPDVLVVDLKKGSVIGGTVVDETGKTVAGVTVSLPVLGSHNWDTLEPLPHQEISDVNGHWVCKVAPPTLGDFWISLDHPQYCTTTYQMADLSATDLTNQVQVLVIGAPINLAGFVIDSTGEPIEGVRITEFMQWRQGMTRALPHSAMSDKKGAFVLEKVRLGNLKLRADAIKYVPKMMDVEVQAGMAPIQIVLARSGIIKCQVVDKRGNPVAGVDVRVRGEVRSWSGVTDAEGRFSWDGAEDHPMQGIFHKSGYKQLTQDLTTDGTEQKIALEADAEALLVGEIRDAETNAPLKQCYLLTGHQQRNGLKVWIGRRQLNLNNGAFAVKLESAEVPTDDYSVLFAAEVKGYYRELAEPVGKNELNATVERTFRVHRGPALTGRVVDTEGKPVHGATVIAGTNDFPVCLHPLTVLPPMEMRVGLTGQDGSFSIEPEKAPFMVFAMMPGFFGGLLRKEMEESADITLQPSAALTVQGVPENEGQASVMEGSVFYAFGAPGERKENDVGFSNLIPGDLHFFRVIRKKGAPAPLVLSFPIAPGEKKAVQLGTGGVTAKGTVTFPVETGKNGAGAMLRGSDNISRYFVLNQNNAFEIAHVPEGEAELQIIRYLDFELLVAGQPPDVVYSAKINVASPIAGGTQDLGTIDLSKK